MRLTVGPLPPAVYWRRRAVVACALIAVITGIVCVGTWISGGGGQRGAKPGASPSGRQSASPGGQQSSSPAASPTASASGSQNAGGGGPGGPGGSGGPGGANPGDNVVASSTEGPVTGGDGRSAPTCADTEISVTGSVSPTPGLYGGTMSLSLTIRNLADHDCARDVGSAQQELQVLQATHLIWSSDHCGTPQQSDVRTFGPNAAVRFTLNWSTFRIAPDDCRTSTTPAEPGQYQLVARLGTKTSEPLLFEIVR